jgi:hypothetical protein
LQILELEFHEESSTKKAPAKGRGWGLKREVDSREGFWRENEKPRRATSEAKSECGEVEKPAGRSAQMEQGRLYAV